MCLGEVRQKDNWTYAGADDKQRLNKDNDFTFINNRKSSVPIGVHCQVYTLYKYF